MNDVEMEVAISDLAQQSFDAEEFPYEPLCAFGNKATTIKKLNPGLLEGQGVAAYVDSGTVDLVINGLFGKPVKPRECFLVPLSVIDYPAKAKRVDMS